MRRSLVADRRSLLNTLSGSIAPTTENDKSNFESRIYRTECLLVSVSLLILTLSLKPMMIDGDGLSLSSRAIYEGFLSGMDPRHSLAAAVLRTIYLPLQAVGLERMALYAFIGVSSLCGAGTFLLLASSIFPRFIKAASVSVLCALGVVASYGVLSRASTIEVYAPALFLDVALIAYCLRSPFTRDRDAVAASLLLVLAVGFHVTNLLMIPFVVALVIGRTSRERIVRTLVWGATTFVLAMTVIVSLLWLGIGQAKWPPDLALIFPRGEVQPPLGLGGHLSRAAYGFARTVAFLPYIRELRTSLVVPYLGLLGAVFLLYVHLARRGFLVHLREQGKLLWMLGLLAAPFALIGVYYYPSDPERWLFLMPALWLLIGLAWDQSRPAPAWRKIGWGNPILLAAIVIGLGMYNAAALIPDAIANRSLAGLREISKLTTRDDLVISASGISGRINEFYVDHPVQAENLTVMALVKEHGADLDGMQADLAARIDRALERNRRVFVFDLIGEGHEKQKGYPWAFLEHDYGPNTFLDVLAKYGHDPVYPPNREHVGIIRLGPRVGP